MPDVNRTELRVIGMSRSGNHALIQWIIAQLHGRFCFLNCCEGKSNPYLTARPMDDNRCFITNIDEFNVVSEQRGQWISKDWLLFNHEDNFLSNACSQLYEDQHDSWVGRSRRRIDLLLLRDPFNLFASRGRLKNQTVSPNVAARIWKQHAKQFLASPRALRHNPVLVRYERWVHDVNYRRSLAARLGLTFTDAGMDRVFGCAGGSSFDGLAYDGTAGSMNVHERWKRCLHESAYRDLFDAEMLRLSRQLYGEHPAASELERHRRSLAPRVARSDDTRPTATALSLSRCEGPPRF